ncbi:MAG TPA: bifunctional phosphopantothenoylcysteine decarboxylase/phosphopantothenate--cysteine ligase CoaBC [Chloroflexota bacterium]|nr:bifunctional phosphopantothenoylcysteine decarboxylase/phosphopantothenate--cysteine ligase CoaBC [Chloroflexota bacterium]
MSHTPSPPERPRPASPTAVEGELRGRNILLGVSGGIACYKVVQVARDLTKLGAEVHVAMTHSAQQFVGPLTFETLTRHKVLTDVMELDEQSEIVHVELGMKVDLAVVAPATCNIIARLAHGLAEDPITVTMLASPAPVLVVPAMDHHMWANAATQANLQTLRQRGMRVLDPLHGPLASGAVGWGRMQEPEAILLVVREMLEPGRLTGRHIVVTAGGTQEPIDPVRYIGNRSSGKMGIAVAEEAARRGAQVTLLYGAVNVPLPAGVATRHTPTADDMARAVQTLAPQADALIMAAAVADYQASTIAPQKIKKGAPLHLELEPTVDILASIAELPLVRVGFAAETQGLIDSAREKLARKRLDLIVGNDVTAEGSGFGTDTNQVVLLSRGGVAEELPLLSKREVAGRILDRVQELLQGA